MMNKDLITKQEIDALYKKVNVVNANAYPSGRMNHGSMGNKLSNHSNLNGRIVKSISLNVKY